MGCMREALTRGGCWMLDGACVAGEGEGSGARQVRHHGRAAAGKGGCASEDAGRCRQRQGQRAAQQEERAVARARGTGARPLAACRSPPPPSCRPGCCSSRCCCICGWVVCAVLCDACAAARRARRRSKRRRRGCAPRQRPALEPKMAPFCFGAPCCLLLGLPPPCKCAPAGCVRLHA